MPSAARNTTEHLAEDCDDFGCPRFPCRMCHAGYRAGYERGYRKGFLDGQAAGYTAGYAAGVAAAGKSG